MRFSYHYSIYQNRYFVNSVSADSTPKCNIKKIKMALLIICQYPKIVVK